MSERKGFTLIELLAVIVILAVIALIATPIIMNVINDSKEGAAKDAMYGYVKAVELASAKQISPTTDAPDGDYTTEDGNLKQGDEILEITFKGTKPANNGTVILSKGSVVKATLIFDGITVEYNGKKAEVGGSSTPTNDPSKVYTVGEELYFDPTGTVTNCSSGKEWTSSNTGTTCYKWNVLKDNGTSIEMLLDHNTTAYVAWNASGNTATGPLEVYNQLKTDTNGWGKVETLTSSDNVTRSNASSGTYTIDYNGMKARLISGQEIMDVVKNNAWSADSEDNITLTSSAWLYQNLSNDNTTLAPRGYWTDTAQTAYRYLVWGVSYPGTLGSISSVYEEGVGVRPIARVLKSNIS